MEDAVATQRGFAGGHEGGHQHEQGALGQVKVGDEPVQHPESAWRMDEDAGDAVGHLGEGLEGGVCKRVVDLAPSSVGRAPGHGFQDARRRGPDRDHAASLGLGEVDGLGRARRKRESFLMHAMGLDGVGLDGEEGSRPDVEGQRCGEDARLTQALQEAWGEMEAGGGGCDGAGFPCIDRLVSILIDGLVVPGPPLDIGGQGHFAMQRREAEDVAVEFHEHRPVRVLAANGGMQGGFGRAEAKGGAGADPFGWPQEGSPNTGSCFFEQQQFDGSLGFGFATPQACRDDLGIIEHEEVAGPEPSSYLMEASLMARGGGPVEDEEPGLVAMSTGMLGDTFRGEMEIEVGDAHGTVGKRGEKWGDGGWRMGEGLG